MKLIVSLLATLAVAFVLYRALFGNFARFFHALKTRQVAREYVESRRATSDLKEMLKVMIWFAASGFAGTATYALLDYLFK
jgi:hypothetical protein